MSDRKVVLKTIELTKHYGGVQALVKANISMFNDEHIGIVGDNGAGKSTFVRSITGVEQPTSGSIIFDGKTAKFRSPTEAREHGIETVYQNLALADHLDVPANIFLGREMEYFRLGPLSWLNKAGMRKKSLELLEQTGIKIPDVTQPVASMSGGQRQCVAISRAASWGSKLIVMDEPTAALGIQETKRVENIIRGLKARGIPVIIISHNLRQIFDLVDRIIVFRQGRIVGVLNADEASGNDVVAMITGVNKTTDEATTILQ
ncbi:MAG: ATP-binding cassette domain-containing protein [Pseudomonadota bacterium]|nr:ATP-binding cassette domain-containing protein [Pseudomonadota bacterium]